jgi:hypothetical protein
MLSCQPSPRARSGDDRRLVGSHLTLAGIEKTMISVAILAKNRVMAAFPLAHPGHPVPGEICTEQGKTGKPE